ncbi:MAG: ArdC-like ssDNA-binding domain-containing protein [Acidimicrobiales bacterium]
MARLAEGIAELTNSNAWQDWLKVQSRFHRYSFNNTLLIQMQNEQATQVAGFQAWRRLGRNVRKGEKAIWIIAPVTRKAEADETDADGKGRVIATFRAAAVFDISQTDGEPLPEVVGKLSGDDPDGLYDRLVHVASSIGYSVEDADFDDERNGDCTYDLKRIRIRGDNSPVQRVKTLAHELAHAMLHQGHNNRSLAELEAESVAFVVCAALGVASDQYSFGYVAGWAGGGDEAISAIKSAGTRIQRTADDILSRMEVAEEPVTAAA